MLETAFFPIEHITPLLQHICKTEAILRFRFDNQFALSFRGRCFCVCDLKALYVFNIMGLEIKSGCNHFR